MSEQFPELSPEQRAQLTQMAEPLRAIQHQIWLLGHPVDRTIIEHIRSQLTTSVQRLGGALLTLTGEQVIDDTTPHDTQTVINLVSFEGANVLSEQPVSTNAQQ